MQDWMDEFRKDRMQDYAMSNPCVETNYARQSTRTKLQKLKTIWARFTSFKPRLSFK